METKFNFKSQVCTGIDQSRRLLGLGLKKETADCMHTYCWAPEDGIVDDLPSWSLHRLIEMIGEEIQTDWQSMCLQDQCFTIRDNLYDNIIDCIEWLIKKGYFNKKYLI